MIGVWVALAGGAGAVARFLVDAALRRRWRNELPWPTLLINVSGSLLLGVLTGLVLYRGGAADLKVVVGTGFCGGYTTFSAASFETVRLIQQRLVGRALGYSLGGLVLTVGAGAVGLLVVRG